MVNPVTDRQRCPLCGGETAHVRGPRDIEVGRRRVRVEDDYLHCANCDEDFYRPGQLDALQARIAAKIREEEGLLLPQEIKAIRDDLGLSQADFERLLGVGPKSVVRWEGGTVFQSAGVDCLIRILGEVPAAAAHLAQRRGINIVRVPKHSVAMFCRGPGEPTPYITFGRAAGPKGRAVAEPEASLESYVC